ncbi:MAG: YitT family protein [Bacilli bacterium]
MKRDYVNKENLYRAIMFISGIFISSLAFNMFFLPNSFISCGLNGISIILRNYVKIEPVIVLFFGNILFISIGILALGIKKTSIHIVGAICYTFSIFITSFISKVIDIHFSNIILSVLAAGLLMGLGEGLIIKAGFSSGDVNIIAKVFSKYFNISSGKALRIIGFFIIGIGGFVYGAETMMLSALVVFIMTMMIDKIVFGISDSKMLIIQSNKNTEIKNILIDDIKSGVTLLKAEGAFTNRNKNIILTIVPSNKLYLLKSLIKQIDNDAFISICDCHEVLGGTKRNKIPFHNYEC